LHRRAQQSIKHAKNITYSNKTDYDGLNSIDLKAITYTQIMKNAPNACFNTNIGSKELHMYTKMFVIHIKLSASKSRH